MKTAICKKVSLITVVNIMDIKGQFTKLQKPKTYIFCNFVCRHLKINTFEHLMTENTFPLNNQSLLSETWHWKAILTINRQMVYRN